MPTTRPFRRDACPARPPSGTALRAQDCTLFYSAEYRRGGLRLAGEYYMAKNVIEASATGFPAPAPVVTITEKPYSWYGQVSYRFNRPSRRTGTTRT